MEHIVSLFYCEQLAYIGFIRTVFINQVILSKQCRISFLLVCLYVFLRWIQCQSCLISHWTTAIWSQEKVCITCLALTMNWLYLEFGVVLILTSVSTLRYCIALRMRIWMCTLSGMGMMIRILFTVLKPPHVYQVQMFSFWATECHIHEFNIVHFPRNCLTLARLFPTMCTIGFTAPNISAANHSHFQGVTRIEVMCNMLYTSSVIIIIKCKW